MTGWMIHIFLKNYEDKTLAGEIWTGLMLFSEKIICNKHSSLQLNFNKTTHIFYHLFIMYHA